jgi:hypothetical protein
MNRVPHVSQIYIIIDGTNQVQRKRKERIPRTIGEQRSQKAEGTASLRNVEFPFPSTRTAGRLPAKHRTRSATRPRPIFYAANLRGRRAPDHSARTSASPFHPLPYTHRRTTVLHPLPPAPGPTDSARTSANHAFYVTSRPCALARFLLPSRLDRYICLRPWHNSIQTQPSRRSNTAKKTGTGAARTEETEIILKQTKTARRNGHHGSGHLVVLPQRRPHPGAGGGDVLRRSRPRLALRRHQAHLLLL